MLQEVYKKAKLRDCRVTLGRVRTYRMGNMGLEKRPAKLNSWAASNANDECQVGLFFFEDLRGRDASTKRARVDYYAGLMLVDSFSKKVSIVSMVSKSAEGIAAAFKKGFVEMGNEPQLIYCDADRGILANETRKVFTDQKVVASVASTHAPLVSG